jgi:hypothetical protein
MGYINKKSKCSKYRNHGHLVGRNFSHCKNNKEWIKLKNLVKDGKIDLYKDFYDYPRELNKLN